MLDFFRAVGAAALVAFSVGQADAATVPTFEGTIPYASIIDDGRVNAVASGVVLDADGSEFELSIGGLFDMSPLGANPQSVFLNIFETPVGGPLVLSSFTLLSNVVEAGPVATLLFEIEDGSALGRFPPQARVVLSGLTGPGSLGEGTVDVAVFLAPIPLPAAAPLMLGGLALLGFAARRRAA